jgi:hypothetical protein
MMKAVLTSETSFYFSKTTLRCITEGCRYCPNKLSDNQNCASDCRSRVVAKWSECGTKRVTNCNCRNNVPIITVCRLNWRFVRKTSVSPVDAGLLFMTWLGNVSDCDQSLEARVLAEHDDNWWRISVKTWNKTTEIQCDLGMHTLRN